MATQFAPPPPAAVSHVLASFDRGQLANFIEVAIGLLDLADGDPDDDTGGAEDEPLTGQAAMEPRGPGCAVSDAAEPDDDARGDVSWTEWHIRHRHKIDATGAEIVGRDIDHNLLDEDTEDDDPTEADGDEHDCGGAEDEELTGWALYADKLPGCGITDPSEPMLGMPEGRAGRWEGGRDAVGAALHDEEPWDQPPTMDGPMPANDRGQA